jgi:kexin
MPSEHDDDNHDQIISSTTTITGATTSVTPVPTQTTLMANPTDHPDRPTKPTGTTEDEHTPTSTSSPAATTSASSWLPSFFPTFGVSAKTQIWIYGAGALILIFCTGLAVYIFMARRKRLRNNPRDEWEFDPLEGDETEGLTGGGKKGAKKGSKRRAGELYDAFAAGSDEESETEYLDEGGDEREKMLYESDEDGKHVIGDDEDEDEPENEKNQGEHLLGK